MQIFPGGKVKFPFKGLHILDSLRVEEEPVNRMIFKIRVIDKSLFKQVEGLDGFVAYRIPPVVEPDHGIEKNNGYVVYVYEFDVPLRGQ